MKIKFSGTIDIDRAKYPHTTVKGIRAVVAEFFLSDDHDESGWVENIREHIEEELQWWEDECNGVTTEAHRMGEVEPRA